MESLESTALYLVLSHFGGLPKERPARVITFVIPVLVSYNFLFLNDRLKAYALDTVKQHYIRGRQWKPARN